MVLTATLGSFAHTSLNRPLPSLPPEIWAQIVEHVPQKSLKQLARVSHTLYGVCSMELDKILNLVIPFIKDGHDLERFQALNKRLALMKNKLSHIKELHLMTCHYEGFVVQNIMEPTPRFWSLPGGILRRSRIQSHSTKDDAIDANFVNRELLSLVPQMAALEHLQIVHSVLRPAAQWPLCYQILASESFRLTTLSLKLEALDCLALPDTGYPCLPVLQVFRVDLLRNRDFEQSISTLLSGSPRLEEVDYTINGLYGYLTPATTAALSQPPLHPDLRCFKWTTLSPYATPKAYLLPMRPFSPLLTTQAVQLVNVTLNPVPSMDVLLSLDLTRLIELRINFDGVVYASSFFYHLKTMTQLETLEMIGSPEVWDQKGWEVHHTLKNLYVQVWINQFVRSLDFYRAKAPNLEKLVVLLFAQEWHRKDFKIQLDVIVSELKSHRRQSSPTTVSGKLWDFGIASDNWNVFGIWHFTKVLRSVASNIPTIWSFYGTGKLELWKDMEKDIDKRWVGELWNQLPTLYNSIN